MQILITTSSASLNESWSFLPFAELLFSKLLIFLSVSLVSIVLRLPNVIHSSICCTRVNS